jgi:hypothetical protein
MSFSLFQFSFSLVFRFFRFSLLFVHFSCFKYFFSFVHFFLLYFFSVCFKFLSLCAFPFRLFFFHFRTIAFLSLFSICLYVSYYFTSLHLLSLLSFCFLQSPFLSVPFRIFKSTFLLFLSFLQYEKLLCTFAVHHFTELYKANLAPSDRVLPSYGVNKEKAPSISRLVLSDSGDQDRIPQDFSSLSLSHLYQWTMSFLLCIAWPRYNASKLYKNP